MFSFVFVLSVLKNKPPSSSLVQEIAAYFLQDVTVASPLNTVLAQHIPCIHTV